MNKTIERRGFLAAGVALMTSLAGCEQNSDENLKGLGGDPEPNYDRTLEIDNTTKETQTVNVEISHAGSNEQGYSDTHTVTGNSQVDVFDFKELKDSYSGIEDFELSAETDKYSDSTGYATDTCHQAPTIVIYEERIDVLHAIC